MTIASKEPPPRRFIAGADAIATAEQKIADLKAQIDAERELSTLLDFDKAGGGSANQPLPRGERYPEHLMKTVGR